MIAISTSLLKTIHELQKLKSLEGSALGGGTNLAIRYGHRKSTDIDLFLPHIIGKEGYESIKKEIDALYAERIFGTQYPCDIDDQFLFLRFFVIRDGETIKVEVLQNMKMLTDFEYVEDVNMVSELDIALFKLMSAANRATEKDIYDLDFLTEKFPLSNLLEHLKEKQQQYLNESDWNVFDLDREVSPLNEPLRLLKFDEGHSKSKNTRPHHSQNRVDILEGQKSWSLARSSWRKKVRVLFEKLNVEFPGPTASDVQ